jgi:hypothetical protein
MKMESATRKNKPNRGKRNENKPNGNSLPPMNADAVALREKTKKRRVSKADIEKAIAALRSLQFDTGKRTNSVKLIRELR